MSAKKARPGSMGRRERSSRTEGAGSDQSAASRTRPRTPRGGQSPGTEDPAITGSLAALVGTILAFTFYFWMIGGPKAMENIELRVAGFDPFAGLPTGFGLGLVAAALLHGAMTASTPLRSRRGALAVASVALYLAAGVPAIGRAALVLAPIAMGAELAWIVYAKSRSIPGSLLLTLHLGAFVSATGFFHDWARYAAAWKPFVGSARALGTLLF